MSEPAAAPECTDHAAGGLARLLGCLFGPAQGTSGRIELPQGGVVLCFDADEPLPWLATDGPLLVARDGAGPRDDTIRYVPLRGLAPLSGAEAVVDSLALARLQPILRAIAGGARRFHLVLTPGERLTVNRRGALVLVGAQRLRGLLAHVPLLGAALEQGCHLRLDPPAATLASTRVAVRAALAAPPARARVPQAGPLSVVHLISSLGAGGAERQLLALVEQQRAAGHRVEVLTLSPLSGAGGHHAERLRALGVEPRFVSPRPNWKPLGACRRCDGVSLEPELLAALERHASKATLLPLLPILAELAPQVLHAWLDEPSCVGGVAGLAVGVPRIVLSTRGRNPTHQPAFHKPHLRESYRLLAGRPEVALLANSEAGAADYARWAELDPARFLVVPNALDVGSLRPVDLGARAAEREQLGLDPDAFLVAGVFRVSAEKRPLDFLAGLAYLQSEGVPVAAVHAGIGPLVEAFQARARELELSVRFLGRVEDPWRWCRLADATLLTSGTEGLPNVLLESQAYAVPVVTTDAGGAREALVPEDTGVVVLVGDTAAMGAALRALADDPQRRADMGRAGRAWVEGRFRPEQVEARVSEIYRARGEG